MKFIALEDASDKAAGRTIMRVDGVSGPVMLRLKFTDGSSLTLRDSGECHCEERSHRPLPLKVDVEHNPFDDEENDEEDSRIGQALKALHGAIFLNASIAERRWAAEANQDTEDPNYMLLAITTDRGMEVFEFWNQHEGSPSLERMEIMAVVDEAEEVRADNKRLNFATVYGTDFIKDTNWFVPANAAANTLVVFPPPDEPLP